MRVKHLHQPGEVHQRPAQAVDLVDHDDIDPTVLDVGQQAAQGRALQRGAGEAAVVVAIGHQGPALSALAGDVRLAGVALGVEGVELPLQALLGALPGVDRAAQPLHRGGQGGLGPLAPAHACPRALRRPKKVQPFQRVPVMARAMADSDR